MSRRKKAVILLSGGLDSTTMLYSVIHKKYKAYCLILDYGQRHKKELQQAKKIAKYAKVEYKLVKMTLPWQGSSLLDRSIKIPMRKKVNPKRIPSTYVPARNIIFLSYAVSFAEAIHASDVFIGANALDYSGYPDCRPEFIEAYQNVVKKGLKTGVENKTIKINAPLIKKSKSQIIKLGESLNVPYHLTWSCYKGLKKPCGVCESCLLREKGFSEAKRKDPAR